MTKYNPFLVSSFLKPKKRTESVETYNNNLIDHFNTKSLILKSNSIKPLKKKFIIGTINIKQNINKTEIWVASYNRLKKTINKQIYKLNLLANSIKNSLGLSVIFYIVNLKSPYLDANILAKYIALIIKKKRFRLVVRNVFSKIRLIKPEYSFNLNLACNLIGIKIQLSGRLTKEKTRPRKTLQTFAIGTFSSSGPNKNAITLIQPGSYTQTNKKGSYTVKIWLALIQKKNSF